MNLLLLILVLAEASIEKRWGLFNLGSWNRYQRKFLGCLNFRKYKARPLNQVINLCNTGSNSASNFVIVRTKTRYPVMLWFSIMITFGRNKCSLCKMAKFNERTVNAVFNQLLDRICRSLYHFTGRDFVDNIWRKFFDFFHFSIKYRKGKRAGRDKCGISE